VLIDRGRAILPKMAEFLRKRGLLPDMEAAELFLEWREENGD